MSAIHCTAIIGSNAKISPRAKIGPYCVIGDNVELLDHVELKSHVCIEGRTVVGEGTIIFPFASIGYPPQDLKYNGEESSVYIGKNNVIREHVTIHLGTAHGGMRTVIGDNCLLMVGVHVAHDCMIGNHVILANNATLGGHVILEDYAIIGGLSAVHQFVRIGSHAIVGGGSAVAEDIIPYGSAAGIRASLLGVNVVGMKRRKFSRREIYEVRRALQKLFYEHNVVFEERVKLVADQYKNTPSVMQIIDFLQAGSRRSICLPVSSNKIDI